MKKYLSFFRIRFTTGLQYRAAALAGVATQFVWGILSILLYEAFYVSDPTAASMTFSELVDYMWLRQAFLALLAVWNHDPQVTNALQDGSVAYEMVRPVDVYGMWYVKSFSLRLSRTVLRCIPILFIAFLMPHPYRMGIPTDFMTFLFFLVSLLLATGVIVAFLMLLYTMNIYTISSIGLRNIFVFAADFLNGGIVPIPMMPTGVQHILNVLPFAAMQNIPLRIYSGNIAGMDVFTSLLFQVFWLCALILLGKYMMIRAQRHIVVQGG